MRAGWIKLIFLVVLVALFFLCLSNTSAKAYRLAQIPTVSIPTVTGTPLGASVVVRAGQDQVNVRSGPSTDYPRVGVLIAGQRVPAYGRTPGGDWVQVAYPGVPGGIAWVYAFLVEVFGNLPIVEPPPTPTPLTTPTIDPTLAAQFIVDTQPTRLPTFTPPPPLIIQTFSPPDTSMGTGGIPMGFIIIGLGVIGLFGAFISLLRGR
jgi:uncharacterized protein YraI